MKKSRRDDVISTANCIIRKVGYSNLSFSQIASALEVTRENVHHYFRKKELLGNACLDIMANDLETKFQKIISSNLSSEEKLKEYFKIYKLQQDEREDCPIVSLLAEYDILPKSMQEQVKTLTVIEQKNMEKILEEGKEEGVFDICEEIPIKASMIISFLKGSVSYSKIYNNFQDNTDFILKTLVKTED